MQLLWCLLNWLKGGDVTRVQISHASVLRYFRTWTNKLANSPRGRLWWMEEHGVNWTLPDSTCIQFCVKDSVSLFTKHCQRDMKWKHPHRGWRRCCWSDYFKLLLAGRLSSSLKAQLNMSADGWKGLWCKEQRDGRKSPSWLAEWKFECWQTEGYDRNGTSITRLMTAVHLRSSFQKINKYSRISLHGRTASLGSVKDSVLARPDLLFLASLLLLLVRESRASFSATLSGVDFGHDLAICLYSYFISLKSHKRRRIILFFCFNVLVFATEPEMGFVDLFYTLEMTNISLKLTSMRKFIFFLILIEFGHRRLL